MASVHFKSQEVFKETFSKVLVVKTFSLRVFTYKNGFIC